MVSRIYKRMVKLISLFKELIKLFLDELDKNLIIINDRVKKRNEYIEKNKEL